MSKPEGNIVGVQGGDGNYSIVNGEDAIVTAAFVKSESGYQRIQIIPKAEGETGITVRDGSGSKKIGNLEIKVAVRDLLAEKVSFKQFEETRHGKVEQITRQYKSGRNFNLNINYTF